MNEYVTTTSRDAYHVICTWLRQVKSPILEPNPLIEFLGCGLTYDVYLAKCMVPKGSVFEESPIVVRLPNEEAEANQSERAAIEHELLLRVHSQKNLPFYVPRSLGKVETPHGIALIQEYLPGMPVDLRWTQSHVEDPWELVAEIAAGTHRIDVSDFSDILQGFTTRREHALKELQIFNHTDNPYLLEAKDWCLKNLPPSTPTRVLHGDLLGQNILVPVDGSVNVIDWNEAFLGDPAFDLAIVTRGDKRPFRKGLGLKLFLEAYNRLSLDYITPQDIHFYELCLSAAWYLEEYNEEPEGAYTESQLKFFRYILRRAKKLGVQY